MALYQCQLAFVHLEPVEGLFLTSKPSQFSVVLFDNAALFDVKSPFRARSHSSLPRSSPQSEVSAYPPFPGVEAHFLRAQLARIAGSTVVCPAGYFTVGEEDGGLEKSEEFAAPAAADLAALEAWAHKTPHIKKQVRTRSAAGPDLQGSRLGMSLRT